MHTTIPLPLSSNNPCNNSISAVSNCIGPRFAKCFNVALDPVNASCLDLYYSDIWFLIELCLVDEKTQLACRESINAVEDCAEQCVDDEKILALY